MLLAKRTFHSIVFYLILGAGPLLAEDAFVHLPPLPSAHGSAEVDSTVDGARRGYLTNLPHVPIHPHAVAPTQPGSARLVRGNQVFEISPGALYRSGLLSKAIANSHTLSLAYEALEQRELQLQETENELRMAESQKGSATERKSSLKSMTAELRSQVETLRADFEIQLAYEGLNGAQVATLLEGNDAIDPLNESLYLIKANGSRVEDNLGYSYRKAYSNGEFGIAMVPSEYLLPTPSDSQDIFYDRMTPYAQRAGDAVVIPLTGDVKTSPLARVSANMRFGMFYDTGFLGPSSSNFAERVSLLGRDDPSAGQLSFVQTGERVVVPFEVIGDTQILDAGGQTVQLFLDANNDQDINTLDVEHFGIRSYNRQSGSPFEGWWIAAGKHHSIFGTAGFEPATLLNNETLIGTIDRTNNQLGQLAVHAVVNDYWAAEVAVEEPYIGDVYFDQTILPTHRLRRWPTVAANLCWADPENNDLFQVGGIVRSVGFQTTSAMEDFATAWGLSSFGKIGNEYKALFFGASGGEGVGDYVQGVQYSAVASGNTVETVAAFGAFAGLQSNSYGAGREILSQVNVAYGYSFMETPTDVGATANSALQQAWVNYARFINKNIAVGVEYQCGFREIASGDTGEDHRFMFILALAPVAKQQTTQPAGTAYLGGRQIDEVVRQFQSGGQASQQSF
jgi:hypothetical protein